MATRRRSAPLAAILALAALGVTVSIASAQKKTQPPTVPRAQRGPALVRTEDAYPTGEKATSVILLERWVPAEVRARTTFEYEIRVTNLTKYEIRDLVLTEQFPPHFTPDASSPRTELDQQGRGVWQWARLAPAATEVIRIQGSTDRTETLSMCATVTFAGIFCAPIKVVEPRLTLTKSAPREVLICDPIPLQFVVSNPGTGVVQNVRVSDTLPAGLATADGRTSFVLDAGDLAAGQSRELSVTVQASKTGEFRNTARAEDESGLTADATATTIVRQPVLAIAKRGPELRYLGRDATFAITVENTGDAPARDTVLTDALPAGTELVAADGGGQLLGGKITWSLGTLAPGAAKTVKLTLKPTAIGVVRNNATVEAYCARATAAASLEVKGIPAILLEVVDDPDPIEVGSDVTYTIEVTNQGSAVGTNIRIDCALPAELQYVSAAGPVPAKAEGSSVRFAPLASLAPKAKATYKVVAKGTKETDARFKVSLQSDQTTSPVEETESTHIY